jgi:hypothetical protein
MHTIEIPWKGDRPPRRDINLITHNSYKRETFMSPVRFEPATTAGDAKVVQSLRSRGHREKMSAF